MKLYYSPGACSLSPHILLKETNLPVSLVRVDLATHKTADGADYYAINPKGAVPLLELDDKTYLSEGPVIAQLICDKAARTDLMPVAGSSQRYQVMEWQSYITSELHKSFSPLFRPEFDAATKDLFRAALRKKYQWVASHLEGNDYLTGKAFTAADAYLFTVTCWTSHVGVDSSGLATLRDFMHRVQNRPAVQAALQAEGLPLKQVA